MGANGLRANFREIAMGYLDSVIESAPRGTNGRNFLKSNGFHPFYAIKQPLGPVDTASGSSARDVDRSAVAIAAMMMSMIQRDMLVFIISPLRGAPADLTTIPGTSCW